MRAAGIAGIRVHIGGKAFDAAVAANRQWALTNRLASVAISLAAIVAMMLARR
jgi:hypothetical protein